jgi:hypothetical protein
VDSAYAASAEKFFAGERRNTPNTNQKEYERNEAKFYENQGTGASSYKFGLTRGNLNAPSRPPVDATAKAFNRN